MWTAFRAAPALLLFVGVLAAAQDSGTEPQCERQICAINVPDNLITSPCTGYTVVVAYSTTSGATYIECSKFLEEQEDDIFIYDRLHAGTAAYKFEGGNLIDSGLLASYLKAKQIPDRFAPRPFCAAKDRPLPHPGEITFLHKRPNNSEDQPYCFRVFYVEAKPGLEVRSDAGDELKPASEEDAKKWAPIREKLAPYLVAPKPATAGESKTASVSSDKAVLYGSPNSDSPGRMYLVKGDKVEIVDDSKAQQGWYLIHYVARSGKSIEKWIRARDLNREPITR